MAVDSTLKPLSLRREGDGLLIEWHDGVRTIISWRDLRANCPCATCIEKRTQPPNSLKVLTPQEVAAGAPQPVRMEARGYYAYQISWNDGHDTGIYSLELLRQLSKPAGPAGGKE